MKKRNHAADAMEKDPLWYKRAVIYQAHVRAYSDSDSNGVGDFRGLTQKLGYLQDLGITALWLMPFYPSPLKDDGYDIADYYDINPIYGTLSDFRTFMREAHRRNLRVITELVLNHTSDQHDWFQKSRRAKTGSRWRDYYVWSDRNDRYKEARIIFKDFEPSNWTWDPLANAFYWHRFYSHQPDLNFENPRLHEELFRVVDFWMEMGVDGVRLDAIPYLYEKEGTNCEGLPETHAFLRKLRAYLDEKYGDRMLLAEANQWPEDAVSYFGTGHGDECHMAFHFPVMPRLFMAVRLEDRVPIVDILEQTPPIPETSQWAVFLRNHDELTLEMVTDEERDYMYRMYAHDQKARINLGIRRRLAPLLGNDRKRIELMNGLLLSLPGTPVIYYGDEIGMGDNIYLGDRNGVRTPMHWSSDKNAGFSRANPQSLYLPIILDPEYHYEAVNVEAQERNAHSLLWWMRRVIALRRKLRAFGEGTLEFLHPRNRKVLAYIRRHGEECILVVANLSRFVQAVELDLGKFRDFVPVELFGRNAFPAISANPYFLTLGPHGFYWFSLQPVSRRIGGDRPTRMSEELPKIRVAQTWEELLDPAARDRLEGLLLDHLKNQPWFAAREHEVKTISVVEQIHVEFGSGRGVILFLRAEYLEREPEDYFLPLGFVETGEAERALAVKPGVGIARVTSPSESVLGLLYDLTGSAAFAAELLDWIARRRRLHGKLGEAEGTLTPGLRGLLGNELEALLPSASLFQRRNTSITYGERFRLKLFRRIEQGINPDLEVGRFLTLHKFPCAPLLLGAVEYSLGTEERRSLGGLYEYIKEGKDAWHHTVDALSRYFERILLLPPERLDIVLRLPAVESGAIGPLPGDVVEVLGTYVEFARLLGETTARLHLALASDTQDPAFAPEPFTPHYQRSLYQSFRSAAARNLEVLRHRIPELPAKLNEIGQKTAGLETRIVNRFRALFEQPLRAQRIRCHGDYHLGQVLYTGKDLRILDFEGEPNVSLSERRIKRSPLRDVASMIRSFHYAAHTALNEQLERGASAADLARRLEPWTRFWRAWVGAIFLRAYLEATKGASFLPAAAGEREILLGSFLLSRALHELAFDLGSSLVWLKVPCEAILELMEGGASTSTNAGNTTVIAEET